MKKALRIIAVSSGLISMVTTLILVFIYLEDLSGNIMTIKNKFFKKIKDKNFHNN